MNTFIAQYHGACDECGGEIKGTEVGYDQLGELVHAACPPSSVDKPKDTPLCQRCWLYHNGECP